MNGMLKEWFSDKENKAVYLFVLLSYKIEKVKWEKLNLIEVD